MYDAILFPTDGSEGSEVALDHALDLAADQDATLHVLHVVETISPGASLHDMIADRMTAQAEELVESVARRVQEREVDVETAVLEGEPAATIVEYADT
jgi:nucleotide-binding universal stress UspA family protein